MINIRTATVAMFAVGAISASSLAGTVDVKFTGTGLGRNVRVTLNGNARDLFAGQLKHNFSNGTGNCTSLEGTHRTFCTELTEYVTSTTAEYECAMLEDAPESDPMGPVAAQAIADLYAYADGRQVTTEDTGDNRDFASAFQIAVWEVVSDYDGTAGSLDITTGSLTIDGRYGRDLDANILAYLNDLFGAVGMNASGDGVFAVTRDGAQDQIVMVPLPTSIMLGTAGLAAIIVRRRRLARK